MDNNDSGYLGMVVQLYVQAHLGHYHILTQKMGARAAIATHSIVARQRRSICFKLAICGDAGAGGLVAPLPCTAYLGKLAIIIVWLFLAQALRRPSPFVLVSQPSLT